MSGGAWVGVAAVLALVGLAAVPFMVRSWRPPSRGVDVSPSVSSPEPIDDAADVDRLVPEPPESDPEPLPPTSCQNCQYAVRTARGALECHRRPPAFSAGVWPVVSDDDWCGEWEWTPGTDTAGVPAHWPEPEPWRDAVGRRVPPNPGGRSW